MTKEQLQYLRPLLNNRVTQLENMRHIVFCYANGVQANWTTQTERELFARYRANHPECLTYNDLWETVCSQCERITTARNQVLREWAVIKGNETKGKNLT